MLPRLGLLDRGRRRQASASVWALLVVVGDVFAQEQL